MKDLLKEYFERDLSEPELDALACLLETGEENALRFHDLAKGFYFSLGLPKPVPPAAGIPRGGWMTTAGGKVISTVAAIASGVLLTVAAQQAWQYFKPAPAPLTVSQSPAPGKPLTVPPAARPPAPAKKKLAAPPPVFIGQSLRPSGAGKDYEMLSVQVTLPTKSPVTVRVIDADNAEVKQLFAGALDAGEYDFSWDGKTAAGTEAIDGTYRIEVKSGEFMQTKNVVLKKGRE